ncbi:hypothetical protein KSP40_PGU021487 [Platanthera guangdongensis]|uniref:Uncharacterized protein n=1 Tax=Platanthera guangdongensis TaxID=2320717 RepID=A0ABR2LZB4_9ASPA
MILKVGILRIDRSILHLLYGVALVAGPGELSAVPALLRIAAHSGGRSPIFTLRRLRLTLRDLPAALHFLRFLAAASSPSSLLPPPSSRSGFIGIVCISGRPPVRSSAGAAILKVEWSLVVARVAGIAGVLLVKMVLVMSSRHGKQ